jgi:hypothetical protein
MIQSNDTEKKSNYFQSVSVRQQKVATNINGTPLKTHYFWCGLQHTVDTYFIECCALRVAELIAITLRSTVF